MRWSEWMLRRGLNRASRKLDVQFLEERLSPSVTGVVFRDYNLNGTQDATEAGVAGIQIEAADSTGALAGPLATTNANGQYSIATSSVAGANLRLRFSNLPTFLAAGLNTGGTSVQFIQDGTAVTANLGVVNPGQINTNANPNLYTPIYTFGYQLANNALPAVTGVAYNANGTPVTLNLASAQQVGTTWGNAFQKSSNSIFVSGFQKRHSGFGPSATPGVTTTGGIYRIDLTTNTVTLALDLQTLGVAFSTGVDPHPIVDQNDGVNDAADEQLWFNDVNSYDLVGKISLGGMKISEDGRTLYVVNLATKELITVGLNLDGTLSGGAPGRFAIPNPNAALSLARQNDIRPFAVGFNDGQVYVGMIDTAESSQNAADLDAYVYQFDPATNTFSAAPVLTFALDYTRGYSRQFLPNSGNWNPWSSTFPAGPAVPDPNPFYLNNAQPWLTDIEFQNGNMILGVRDRFGDQTAFMLGSTTPGDTQMYGGISPGDILRAAPNGGGGFTLESNGTSGGVTTGGAGNGQGPGGGEYYGQDNFNTTTPANEAHQELTMGGLVQVAGFADVASTAIDPIRPDAGTTGAGALFTGGILHLNNTTGNRTSPDIDKILYNLGGNNFFGKANGLGDLSYQQAQGIQQIGNRVWLDSNANNVQDAGELAVAGVTVELQQLDAGNNVVSTVTTTTSVTGEYFFNVLPNTNYRIRINSTDAALAAAGAGPLVTANGGADDIDSDAVLTAGFAVISLTTSGQSVSNHTFDFGYQATLAGVGDTVFRDLNSNGIQDAGEPGVQGVIVELFNAGNVSQGTRTTDANGFYQFLGLQPGTYTLALNPASFPAGTTLTTPFVGSNTAVDSNFNPATNRTPAFTLTTGQYDPTQDAGLVNVATPVSSISGSVFVDSNGDCIQQAGEPGIGNVVITLSGTNDLGQAVTLTALTTALGTYSFTGLRPGVYTVVETQPAGYIGTQATVGNSGGTAAANRVNNITLGAGVNATNYDFCEMVPSTNRVDVQIRTTVAKTTLQLMEKTIYTAVVRNNGPDVATNVTASIPLPANLQLVSLASISQGGYVAASNRWNIGTLQPGQEVTINLVVCAIAPGSARSIGVVRANESESTYVNNNDNVAVIVPVAASITKQDFLSQFPNSGANLANATGLGIGSTPASTSLARIVVAPNAGVAPLVQEIDRTTGLVLSSFYAYDVAYTGGVSVAVGDVNGDGVQDIVTATKTSVAHVKVFDGATGNELRSFFAYDPAFSGGVNLAVGDLNGDGRADIVTGARTGGGPHVKVFDGATGTEVRSFFAYDLGFSGGVVVAVGDVNGDGAQDIITGTESLGAHVKAFNFATVGELQSFFAYGVGYAGGVSVAAGDVDGDGRDDIITGTTPGYFSHVQAFQGVSSNLLKSFFAFTETASSGATVTTVDANADGRDDIIVGPAANYVSRIRTYNSANDSLLDDFLGNDPAYARGVNLAAY
jgi:uncharacterized repeat protein (TIGR01451 family)